MDDLTYNEKLFVEILKIFDFLNEFGFSIKKCSINNGRSRPSVIYENYQNAREFHIIGDEQTWSIEIIRTDYFYICQKQYSFDISDFYDYFGACMSKDKTYSLKSQSNFVKQYLLPVINGDVWIYKEKGKVIIKKENKYLRKSIVKNFSLSIILIICLFVILFSFL